MRFPNKEELAKLREKYPTGTIIKLHSMADPFCPILPGTIGEVTMVDDAGNIHMKWENGSSLALIEGVDSFSIARGGEK